MNPINSCCFGVVLWVKFSCVFYAGLQFLRIILADEEDKLRVGVV